MTTFTATHAAAPRPEVSFQPLGALLRFIDKLVLAGRLSNRALLLQLSDAALAERGLSAQGLREELIEAIHRA